MKLSYPIRGQLLARLPVFTRVSPLARPRARYKVPGVYQPLENQKELRAYLRTYTPLGIREPVIIDTYVNFARPKKTTLELPAGRNHGDEDNLRKAINDALTDAGHLLDDAIVLGGLNFKAFGTEDCVLIEIYAVSRDETGGVTHVLYAETLPAGGDTGGTGEPSF